MYCLCVNVYCHRVTTQLQLTNISYRIIKLHSLHIPLWRALKHINFTYRIAALCVHITLMRVSVTHFQISLLQASL
jgi:hypothetical protein